MRRRQVEIGDRSEVRIKSHRADLFAKNAAMLLEQLFVFGLRNLGRRRRRGNYVPQAIDSPTFHVDAGEDWCADYALALHQQPEGLLRRRDVAGKEDNAGRL